MKNMREKVAWTLAATLGLLVVAALSGVIDAGPLDPPGAPAPTGKTLEEIPGSWSRTLPANDGAPGPDPPAGCNSTRFQCVMGDAAVLDRETGLVWERAPAVATGDWHVSAVRGCLGAQTGGRLGWRLPSLEELRSLLDTTNGLPAGHPFVDAAAFFWTSTTVTDATTQAYIVNMADPFSTNSDVKATGSRRSWCVRRAAGYDAY